MTEMWEKKKIPLAYWLGDICLFRKTFKLEKINIDFQNHDPTHLTPKPAIIDEDTNGYMLYSIPLEPDHKTLWLQNKYIHYISQSFHRYFIDLNLGYDEYISNFSSKTRSTLKRKLRKYEKESGGTIDWRIYASPEEMKEFYQTARTISKETYQEKLLNAGLPDSDPFIANMLESAKNNNVRGYLLFFNGKAVSYLYTPIEDGRFIYAFLGYLPEISKLSPGTVLLFIVLKHLFENEEGAIFDFTEGQSEQKKQFSTHSIYCVNMICLKWSITNYFWLLLNMVVNSISYSLGKFLDFLGIKKIIKKYMRR